MKATAIAYANIALVKYWGKRDPALILPYNGSISMTCDGLQAKTTVEFGNYSKDEIIINDEELKKDEKDIISHLEKIKKMAKITEKVKVVSETNFPIAAGLASSAAGLASLTLAATQAAGLEMNERELSILARQGSGSACRSIYGGFVEWLKGQREDGTDSYAQVVAPKEHWPEFAMIACIVSEKKKAVGSRTGMAQTVQTSPYYKEWVKAAEQDLEIVREAIKSRDFEKLGKTAELNCLKMHATMITTNPPIIYWTSETMDVIHAVRGLREEGISCYFTMDAGPQVKILCLQKDIKAIEQKIRSLGSVKRTIVCSPGEGAKISKDHLF